MDTFFNNTTLLLLVHLLLTAGFAFLIFSILLRFATTLGIRESKDMPVRWSATQKPALGGIAFYIIFLFSIAFYPVFFRQEQQIVGKDDIGLIAAATLAFLMGLADDAYDTRPWLKLFVQISCGALLTFSGTHALLFSEMWMNHLFTICWVVGIMNSINMLDNMDAISSLVSLIILLFTIFITFMAGTHSDIFTFVLTGVAASLFAFLFYNWHPSKMFMGDTGSQVLGIFLASAGVHSCLGELPSGPEDPLLKLASLALVFCIPFADTGTVIIGRILKGRSPFVGGRDHTTHALFFKGVTEKRIAVLFSFLTVTGCALAYLILRSDGSGYILAGLCFSYFVILFITLFALNRITIR